MDFIAQARAERTQISAQKENLLADIARLDARLTELDTYLRVAEGYSQAQTTKTGNLEHKGNGRMPDDELAKRGAQKRLIEEALRTNVPHGLTKAGVGQWIADNYNGFHIAPNSIGVTLDRLKKTGAVRLEGNRWISQFGTSGPALTAPAPVPDDLSQSSSLG